MLCGQCYQASTSATEVQIIYLNKAEATWVGLEKSVLKTPFQEDDFGSHGEDAFEGGKVRERPRGYFRDH